MMDNVRTRRTGVSIWGSTADRVSAKRKPEAIAAATRLQPFTQIQFGSNALSLRKMDLAGQWHILPYNDPGWGINVDSLTTLMEKAPTINLPSNWFLMGSKEYPAKATVHPPPLDPATPPDPDILTKRGLDHAGTVWFSRDFEWSPGRLPVILDMDMVDYYAQVYINGKKAGQHEGYFQKWSLDVSKHLFPGRNTIAIRISSPTPVTDYAGKFPLSWPFRHNQVKGIFSYHDTRPGGTTWRGHERNTGGLIRGVQIRQTSGLDVANVRITPKAVSETSATLDIETTVRNWTDKPLKAKAKGEIKPKNFQPEPGQNAGMPVEYEVEAPPGVSKIKTEIKMNHPALWWTWDFGKPNLYQLNLDLISSEDEILDRQSQTFGVRSITVDKDWRWFLNGQRFYPRGSNYISTQWLSQADRAWYNRDIQLAREANMNAMRVHAHLERPEFYEAADEAGILIWQDFPLQWSYTADPGFKEEALKQAGDMVDRFGTHPSIALWSMHNESPYLPNPDIPHHNPKENLELDEALTEKVKGLDSSRRVHRDSGTGDSHRYGGWYWDNLKDFDDHDNSTAVAKSYAMPNEPCVTEYGAQALPGIEGLKKIFGNLKTIWPLTQEAFKTLRAGCFQPNKTFQFAKVSPGNSLEEFVANSQQYQANYIRYSTEVMRRQKNRSENGTSGLFHFMFTDDAPAVTWSVVDYFRQPKLGFTALKMAMQPVLPSIEYDVYDPEKPLTLHVVNDLQQRYENARLEWRIRNGETVLQEGSQTVDIAPDSVTKIQELGVLPEVSQGDAELEVLLKDAQGQVIGRNTLNAKNYVKHPDTVKEEDVMPRHRYSEITEDP